MSTHAWNGAWRATTPVAGQRNSIFASRVLLPVVIATLAATLLSAFGLYRATTRSDAISMERQIRETRHAVDSSLDTLAVEPHPGTENDAQRLIQNKD
jgi:hypothetical protein